MKRRIGQKVRNGCHGVGLLCIATVLVSCGDEDRVLTARCDARGDEFAAATFPIPDTQHATIGSLHAREDAVGTLYQIARDPGRTGSGYWSRVYTVPARVVTASHDVYWSSQTLRARLEMHLDGEPLTQEWRATMEPLLASHTGVVVWDVERQGIENVLQAINADSHALKVLENAAADSWYLVVSSRLVSKGAGLFYAPGGGIWLPDGRGDASIPFISVGTFRIGHTNYHTHFVCAPAEEITSKATATKARVAAVYFYAAVRYDPVARRAAYDPRAIDLDLLRATLRASPEP